MLSSECEQSRLEIVLFNVLLLMRVLVSSGQDPNCLLISSAFLSDQIKPEDNSAQHQQLFFSSDIDNIDFLSESLVRAVKTVVPVSSSSLISTNGGGVNNFKISRLNDALQAINPRYQPIGFSITSMESCSPSVLQDAISAAETGVFTLLSVIGEILQFCLT